VNPQAMRKPRMTRIGTARETVGQGETGEVPDSADRLNVLDDERTFERVHAATGNSSAERFSNQRSKPADQSSFPAIRRNAMERLGYAR
jgi:hypothetical protein